MANGEVGEPYDAYYFAHGCGRPYQRDDEWLSFFKSIADRVCSEYKPASVLDAGCAMGFFVEALRKIGVEAYGVDVSSYAIENVHPDIRPYCWVGSVLDPLPRRYDLIVCIEVFEHLPQGDAERALDNFCSHTDQVLFSSTAVDYKEASHYNVRPPEYWAEQFARRGFFRDVDLDASFITPWAAGFRKENRPVHRIVRDLERLYWLARKENADLRELAIADRHKLAAGDDALSAMSAERDQALETLTSVAAKRDRALEQLASVAMDRDALAEQVSVWEARWVDLGQSLSWRALRFVRLLLAPTGSRRERLLKPLMRRLAGKLLPPGSATEAGHSAEVGGTIRSAGEVSGETGALQLVRIPLARVDPVEGPPPLRQHRTPKEIIVCVHNAFEDVKRCLDSVIRNTSAPYTMILVDDGSESETRDYLAGVAEAEGFVLLRNDSARGYTRAANQALRSSSAKYVILLNSDAVVTPLWADRLIACAESDPRIGMVGPLSNTASWQSIPDILVGDDWATNPIPQGMTIDDMALLIARNSARSFPRLPLLNGFCLLIKQEVIKAIGYLDDEHFGDGYGEEDDYAFRARGAGWTLALADDAYVYHAQSKSYSHESRQRLSRQSGRILAEKHGQRSIQEAVTVCRRDRVLEGIRARGRVMVERQKWVESGGQRFRGKRVLFLLPVAEPGGGGNVVIDEAMAMTAMGVDVQLFNLESNREGFVRGYPGLELPIAFGDPGDIPRLASDFDAVIATANFTVEWLGLIGESARPSIRGYYVQGFEPLIYPDGGADYRRALASYSLITDLVRITKTEWTRRMVLEHAGVESHVIGPSLNIDLFRPRPRRELHWPAGPLRVCAMVRPSTPYRAPRLTMEVLHRVSRTFGPSLEIVVFGCDPLERAFQELPWEPDWRAAGTLRQQQVARLLNEVDIFVDLSSHQAMGLTAMEAMACGAAVMVPLEGGAGSIVRDEYDGLVVDTSSGDACERSLSRLIEEHEFRTSLQERALADVVAHAPEGAAFRVLSVLFGAGSSDRHADPKIDSRSV